MSATRTGQLPCAAFSSPRPRPRVDEVTLAARKTAESSVLASCPSQDAGLGASWLLPDSERVAVELVARAVETTGLAADEPRWFEIEELSIIGVRLSADHRDALLIQVRDSDSASPYPSQGAYPDRHLMAVHELSYQWNWYPLDDGKVIWTELVPRQGAAVQDSSSAYRAASLALKSPLTLRVFMMSSAASGAAAAMSRSVPSSFSRSSTFPASVRR